MRVLAAVELRGVVTASVELEDGSRQTVVVPTWATKAQILLEAARLASLARDARLAEKVRGDLVDP